MPTVAQLIERARDQVRSGDLAASESTYRQAADLARSQESLPLVAHALRHIAELAAHRGAGDRALSAADEALAIYQADPTHLSLDLANAHRVRALALDSLGRSAEAAKDWLAARDLYEGLEIAAGVAECDARLLTN